jgi:hypothetical protein
MSLERARRVADAVLYEGYVLFPYRASARKNRYRWTFGVVMPRGWSGGEPSSMTLECLVETDGRAPPAIEGLLRFLQVERRQVQAAAGKVFSDVDELVVGGEEHVTWDEGVEHELAFAVEGRCAGARVLSAALDGAANKATLRESGVVVGRVLRTRRPLSATVTASLVMLAPTLAKVTLTIDNLSALVDAEAPRQEAVNAALVGAHLILAVRGGAFVSLIDPPAHASAAAGGCASVGLFPVLAGEPGTRALLLASPIALSDHPAIAAESPGPTFDGAEVDELLALSTRALGDDEKRQARATDPRAAAVIDRAEGLSDEALLALHGKTRTSAIAPGSRVRVRLGAPSGPRRTDAQDMFLEGRVGVVEEVREDFDGQTHVAIILEDDPAAEFHRWYGRHLHFRPDELELVEAAP